LLSLTPHFIGNIRVFCRVRRDDRVNCVLQFPDQKGLGTPIELVVPVLKDNADKKKFEFDRVYSPDATQDDVFADTDAIMTSCVDGYNVCIMAYGQTGSGKVRVWHCCFIETVRRTQ
jgi:kinesin family protein C2/C3